MPSFSTKTLLFCLLAAVLAACGKSPQPETPTPLPVTAIEGRVWRVQSYMTPAGTMSESMPRFPVTAAFQNGAMVGHDGCNQYFASYQAQGNQIRIQPGGTTQQACTPEEVMTQAADYQRALSFAASFAASADQLVLSNGEAQAVLTYRLDTSASTPGAQNSPPLLAQGAPNSPLAGTSWQASSYDNGKQSHVSVLPGTEISAVFDPYGKLNGLAGCNRYTAFYELKTTSPDAGGKSPLQIWAATPEQKICSNPQGVMEQELLYLAAIQQAAAYRLGDEELVLFNAAGAEMARFVRR